MPGRRKGKKAIVGIEAAIVLIAFVIVAAALAFVVLNMGMFTTQKSKEVMNQALNEASSALEVDGSVMAYVNAEGKVAAIYIPLKISPGQQAVDLSTDKIDVVVRLPGGTFQKVNSGVAAPATTPVNLTKLYEDVTGASINATFYIVQSLQEEEGVPAFSVLEVGEKALLVIYLPTNLELGPYQSFTVEIRPLAGAPLTIERMIPPTLPVGEVINLV
ncbi:archaellin/type IV pilin N-terminal domain-containing protein [Desulfurococcus amylolyticus]|uniref:archaellin/type IV pilin N-terminal domain-containing protein n=1 Tax=Desulfurococcus amylolyticus TaxID=94694 RepID=UPI0023F4F1EE|nr:archaellin/type IV pilin N-terminal domain-containing protein [Desulfurococcus amylolyticus]